MTVGFWGCPTFGTVAIHFLEFGKTEAVAMEIPDEGGRKSGTLILCMTPPCPGVLTQV